ncbi:RNA polymerase [Streptomyces alfalfae]|uniref:RNA polymerase sigma factor n=1 Tax=Streptomyces alfalfae TaxID=1642299 RepID=A0ABM6H278_9ACTN|nr:sigma-70 family RNA polymerase sigma factor [Streptomyces alfalfae]APY89773.1 RNA polymerase [Streptomyces alfalfae]AYA20225.1 sigma-70 family RNA polymerase sigma factor [Streptomyces fradiae]RXX43715.1 RNA polymerase [Streptomyces alfalfae]RZM93582.1 sigma-70 family RNA polymerase sigma factor [Streptomyces alfalfae]
MSSERQVARVRAAQDGNQQAQDTLVSEYLPLVYNIVGRALNGHADVDDVVQETMIRVLGGLDGLRDPENFRSWLVAITMNQIRGHWRERATGAIPGGGGLGDGYDVVDPGADFVDLTITRLGLSGQRRETAEATRWLDEDDRALLSLWWLEAAGELTRAEVAEALELSPQHAAVRVQRMKAQLETSRVVVRALATEPRCAGLQQIASGWDGVPSALWRKRLARHARDCAVCTDHWSNLVPAERLLVALALVPVGAALTGAVTRPGLVTVGFAEDAPLSARVLARRARAKRQRRTAGVAAAVAALVAGGAAVHLLTGPEEDESARATAAAPAESAATKTAKSASPSAQRSASPSAKPSPGKSESKDKGETKEKEKAGDKATKKPKLTPTPTKAPPKPKPEASAPQVPSGTADQVISLVNAERAKAGCGPVRANSQLATAATRHSADMDARDYFDHTSPDGTDPGDRITAAGYRWSTYGENIARGQQTPAAVMDSWMNSSGHRANILNCDFKELGIGIHRASGGPWWTQAFGASR